MRLLVAFTLLISFSSPGPASTHIGSPWLPHVLRVYDCQRPHPLCRSLCSTTCRVVIASGSVCGTLSLLARQPSTATHVSACESSSNRPVQRTALKILRQSTCRSVREVLETVATPPFSASASSLATRTSTSVSSSPSSCQLRFLCAFLPKLFLACLSGSSSSAVSTAEVRFFSAASSRSA
jgi:hypothetical protein